MMAGWSARALIALASFAVGAAVAGAVVFSLLRGDGGDGRAPEPTATSAATPTETPTPGPTASPTPVSAATLEAALDALVRGQLGEQYAGPCPERVEPGQTPPGGACTIELYRSDELATFTVTIGFQGAVGEAVLTRAAEAGWSATFVPAPPADLQLAVGGTAVVYLVRDCLNFREMPSLASNPPTSCQIDGTRGRVAEGPIEAEGRRWWRIEGYGWATDEFLAAVP
jgi:hypothetical protein